MKMNVLSCLLLSLHFCTPELVSQEGAEAPAATSVVCHRAWDKYTVPEGVYALGLLDAIGFKGVEEFQRAQGLTPDGIVGPSAWGAMAKAWPGGSIGPGHPSPITIRMERRGESDLAVMIVNRTPAKLVVSGSGSLVAKRAGRKVLSLPLRSAIDGEDGPVRYRGGEKAAVEFEVPVTLPAYGSVAQTIRIARTGNGRSEVTSRCVVLLDRKQVFMAPCEAVWVDYAVKMVPTTR